MTIPLGVYCAGGNYIFAAFSMRKAAEAEAGKKALVKNGGKH